jgi:hypothetical protein
VNSVTFLRTYFKFPKNTDVTDITIQKIFILLGYLSRISERLLTDISRMDVSSEESLLHISTVEDVNTRLTESWAAITH